MNLAKIILVAFISASVSAFAAPAAMATKPKLSAKIELFKKMKTVQNVYIVMDTLDPHSTAKEWTTYFKKTDVNLKDIRFEEVRAENNRLFLPYLKEPIVVNNDEKSFEYKGIGFNLDTGATPEKNLKKLQESWGSFKEFQSGKKVSALNSLFISNAFAEEQPKDSMTLAILYSLRGSSTLMGGLVTNIRSSIKEALNSALFEDVEIECKTNPPRFLKSYVHWGETPPTYCGETEYCESYTWDNGKPAYTERVPFSKEIYKSLYINKEEQKTVEANLTAACKDPEKAAAMQTIFYKGPNASMEKRRNTLMGNPAPAKGAK